MARRHVLDIPRQGDCLNAECRQLLRYHLRLEPADFFGPTLRVDALLAIALGIDDDCPPQTKLCEAANQWPADGTGADEHDVGARYKLPIDLGQRRQVDGARVHVAPAAVSVRWRSSLATSVSSGTGSSEGSRFDGRPQTPHEPASK